MDKNKKLVSSDNSKIKDGIGKKTNTENALPFLKKWNRTLSSMFWKLKEMFFLSSKMIAIIALAISLFAALISVFTLWHQVKPEQI